MTLTKPRRATALFAACGALTLGVWAASRSAAGEATPRKGQPAARTATAADRERSQFLLRQIMLAVHMNHDTNHCLITDIRDKDGKPLLSWRVALLPYIEHQALYREFKLDEPWDSEHNKKLLAKMPALYRSPAQPKGATETYFQVFAGPGTPFDPKAVKVVPAGRRYPFPYQSTVRLEHITDGLSDTFGVIEAGPPVPWTKPADIPFDPDPKKPLPKLPGPFSNELHVAVMDTDTHALIRLPDTPDVMRGLITGHRGDAIPELKLMFASLPAMTPAEKEMLKAMIARNRRRVAEIDRLLKEQADLLVATDQPGGDFSQAEDHAKRLQRIATELLRLNRKIPPKPAGPMKVK